MVRPVQLTKAYYSGAWVRQALRQVDNHHELIGTAQRS
jgi:hypothetical protein